MNTVLSGAALALVATAAQGPFAVDTLRPTGGPEVLWHRHASPLVSLRLSAGLDPRLPAGAAELLQELARPDAVAAAHSIGATLELNVSGDEAVIAITGPASAFDALVSILRRAAAEPVLSVAALPPARARAEDRVLAALERPVPRLRAVLRARLLGAAPRGADLAGLEPEEIRRLAARVYEPGRLRVILVGDPPADIVRSAFTRWPRHPVAPAWPDPDSTPPLPRAQAHHAWAGLAYPVDAGHAAVAVAAALVQARIDAADLRLGRAEAWALAGRSALVLIGGAPVADPAVVGAARITAFRGGDDDDDVSALARFLRRMVAEAAALAGEDDVASAAASLRHRILTQARTAAGRAAVLGEWAGPPGAPRPSVHDVLGALAALCLDDVRSVLDGALAATPLVAEVRP